MSVLTYDDYLDRQTEQYLDSKDYDVSDCCGAEVLPETDICSKCNEHYTIISTGEYNYNEWESAMEDAGDAKRERMRDE